MKERHLVWDWNGTLLDDLTLVVKATNATFACIGGPAVTVEEHRRQFRRPIADYYAEVLGRPVDRAEFEYLNQVFHDAYQALLPGCELAAGARDALAQWAGTQSLLSMWYHNELLPIVDEYGLTRHFERIDGLRYELTGAVDHKGPYLCTHLEALEVDPAAVVLVGDSVDDAHAAQAAGAACVLYSGGFTGRAQLQATGAPVTDTLVEAVALARTI